MPLIPLQYRLGLSYISKTLSNRDATRKTAEAIEACLETLMPAL